ncbi:MAG: hypothetical protein PHX20_02205 [Candidatus Omnitrophica bacterium]|nr:hypothetical protein [Candidatus Omnitrophota bacterium]MDD5436334.1 hypothetical protein [Candidatus Omnitrophota bacterium]
MKRRLFTAAIAFVLSAVLFFNTETALRAALITGNDWVKMRNAQKAEEVKGYIKSLRSQGVVIKGDPVAYCRKLDAFYAKHPDLKKEECGKMLKTIMIMEYDWEQKGVDKDTLARQWLGDDLYKKNKARKWE